MPHPYVCNVPTATEPRGLSEQDQCGQEIKARVSPSGKEVPELMERHGHHSICGVECLFDAIPVMNININVDYTGMIPGRKYFSDEFRDA